MNENEAKTAQKTSKFTEISNEFDEELSFLFKKKCENYHKTMPNYDEIEQNLKLFKANPDAKTPEMDKVREYLLNAANVLCDEIKFNCVSNFNDFKLYNSTIVGALFGWNVRRFKALLGAFGIMYIRKGEWVVKAELVKKGLARCIALPKKRVLDGMLQTIDVVPVWMWTDKGVEWLVKTLGKYGLTPKYSERRVASHGSIG